MAACREVWSAGPIADPWSPLMRIPPFVRRFLATEAAGGVVLVVAAAVALVAASSPWHEGYASLVDGRVHDVVNEGLMTLFFLVVGLEIKRELTTGDLRDRRVAAVPVAAAIGGMVVPALVFAAVNRGQPGIDGWGIPMATDIAFAVGVLALLTPRVPAELKLFLLSLAVVDDVGAIVVIALFYASGIDVAALGVAAAIVVAAAGARALRVDGLPVLAVLGVSCWLALLESGVHATLAGVVFGLLAPAARTEPIERVLHPLTSFAVVPVFALVNAGVRITPDALGEPGAGRVAVGVVAGLVAGKLAGVLGATWLVVRAGLGALPGATTWRDVAAVGAVAGIGFTVSLFVTDLAFAEPALAGAARIGIVVASVLAAAIGFGIGRRSPRSLGS